MARIGMLTPSSNTVLEPESYALLREIEGVSLHFSRFKVTEIALDRQALGQFDDAPMLRCRRASGHAKVDCITWNGTSAGWLGLDADGRSSAASRRARASSASTCVLTYRSTSSRRTRPHAHRARHALHGRRAAAHRRDFATEGVATVAESHLGIRDNFSFGLVDAETLDRGVTEVARARPDAIVILCTNLGAARLGPAWERRLGIPVLDSVAISLYGALAASGFDTKDFARHGALFAQP